MAFPRQKLQQSTVNLYADVLADLDYSFAEDAVRGLIRQHNFFPTIAEIRAAYFDLHPQETRDSSYPNCRTCGERLAAEEMVDETCTEVSAKGWRHYHCADQVIVTAP